jgi:hypothetical protein
MPIEQACFFLPQIRCERGFVGKNSMRSINGIRSVSVGRFSKARPADTAHEDRTHEVLNCSQENLVHAILFHEK